MKFNSKRLPYKAAAATPLGSLGSDIARCRFTANGGIRDEGTLQAQHAQTRCPVKSE